MNTRSLLLPLLGMVLLGGCQTDGGDADTPTVAPTTAAPAVAASSGTTTTVSETPLRYLEATSVKVVTTEGGRLDWSRDGRIAYDKRTRDVLYDVWIMDYESPDEAYCVTCDAAELPEGHRGNPEWHPSGEWIIFQAGVKVGNALVTQPGSGVANEIWAIRPDGTDAVELFDIPDPNSFDGALHPHFNHAGDEIVFARYVGFPVLFDIYTLPFDAADPGLTELTEVIPGDSKDWPDALYETHGYSHDDTQIVFTGFTNATEHNNDILIADATTGVLIDQVTTSEEVWDEHAHFQPGTDRLLWSSSADIPDGAGTAFAGGLDSQADWWVRELDGEVRRLTYFADPDWPLRNATMIADGSSIEIPDKKVFAADGEFSHDGSAYAGVLLFRTLRAEEWIVIVEFEEVPASG